MNSELGSKADSSKESREKTEQPLDLAQKGIPSNQQGAQTLAMHSHLDPSKTPFPTLRLPVPSRGLPAGISAITNSPVGTQLLASKQVSRITGEGVVVSQQSHGGSSLSGATLVSGQTTRQVMTTTVYPVMSLSNTSGTATAVPMASIIRGATAGASPGALYSSHMPRGPAAVASLSAGPKSAVATPILRHAPATLQHFTPRVLGMTAPRGISPMAKTAALTQVIDSSKLGRPLVEGQRTTSLVVAPPGVSMAKISSGLSTASSSQQTLATEKFFKPVLSPHHMVSAAQQGTRGNTSTCVVTIAPGLVSSPQQQLRVAATHPTLTVVTGKASQGNAAVAIASKLPTDVIGLKKVSPGGQNVSCRPLQQQQVTQGGVPSATAIPVARVYPQQPGSMSGVRPTLDSSEGGHRGGIYITHSPVHSNTASNQGQSLPAVMLSEGRSESGALRLTSLPRGTTGTTSYTTVPSNAYFYEPYQVGGATMHSFQGSGAGTTQGPAVSTALQGPFATSLPTATLRPSLPGNVSASGARPLGSLVVTVEGNRQQVALHPVSSVSTTSASVTGLLPGSEPGFPGTGLTTSSYGVIHGNHNTSPRPSILRKRTTDMSAIQSAKKNLMTCSLPQSSPGGSLVLEPASKPHPPPAAVLSPAPPNPAPTLAPPPPTVAAASTPSTVPVASAPATVPSSAPAASLTAAPMLAALANAFGPLGSRNSIISGDSPIENGFQSKKEESSSTVKADTHEPSESASRNHNSTFSTPNGLSAMEASPRKKPRKQQLAANDMLESHSTDGEDNFGKETRDPCKREFINDDESSKWVTFSKRPSMSLLNSYQHSWKSKHNHFLRHADVKPKDEKKQSVNELANQKGVLQKANGWKIYHLATQMDEVRDAEETVRERLGDLLMSLEQKNPSWKKPLGSDEERIMGKLTDLIKGNLQRSKIVQEQIGEVKQQVVKVVDHKVHIVNVIGKYVSKRHIKKKTNS